MDYHGSMFRLCHTSSLFDGEWDGNSDTVFHGDCLSGLALLYTPSLFSKCKMDESD